MKVFHRQRLIKVFTAWLGICILALVWVAAYQFTAPAEIVHAQLRTITLSAGTYSVNENGGMVTVSINISSAPTTTATIDYFTSNGTATAGGDYVSASGTLTFTAGTAQTVDITIVDNAAIEPNENFLFQITNPMTATLGSPNVATITIIDDDGSNPTPTPIFADTLEPNNNFSEASTVVPNASASCDLTFYPPGDADFFRWWGLAGITYIVSTSNLDLSLDTELQVYDTTQTLIGSNDDVTPGDFSSEFRFTASVDGYYYARVINTTPANPVDKTYCFEVDFTVLPTSTPLPTPPPFPTGADECEFNSTIETACLFVPGETKSLNFLPTLGSEQDTDMFKIWIKPGIEYTCETNIPDGSPADTNIILLDNNGNPFNPWIGNDDKEDAEGIDFGSKVKYLSTYTGWLFAEVGPVNVPPYEEATLYTYTLTCTATDATPTPTATATFVPLPPGTGGGATSTPVPTQAFPTPLPTPTPIDPAQFIPTPIPPPLVQFQPLPTSTPLAGVQPDVTINVTLYYDKDRNFAPGEGEGIVNAAVALYDNSTGQLLSFGQTNEAGVARFPSITTSGAVRVVIPFLNYSQVVVGTNDIRIRVAPQPLPIGIP